MEQNELKILLSGTYIKNPKQYNSLDELYHLESKNKKIKDMDKQLEYIEKNSIKLIDFFCQDYPEILRKRDYPPAVLYTLGDLKERELSIAVVGTRYPSGYGEKVVKYMIPYLTKAGFTIVSGLAKGIDTLAHKETIKNSGYTIAVLGCGIDVVYPPENKKLYSQMAEKGCIISEFPLGTKPLQYNFPIRNKTIASLSKGTLVVEADIKSGSLITARLTEELSKPVFAIPGDIFSKRSKGTNKLISEGAIATTDIDTILSYFYLELKKELQETKQENKPDISDKEKQILNAIEGDTQLDMLITKTSMDISELNDILFDLEIKGLIKRTPSSGYEKL